MPARPVLTLFEVRLAQIELGIEVPEGLRDRFDAFPVHTGGGVQRACAVIVAGQVCLDEIIGVRYKLLSLILDVEGVGVRCLLNLPANCPVAAKSAPESVMVNSARMPSPVIPGLHAVRYFPGNSKHEVSAQTRSDVLHLAEDAARPLPAGRTR